MNKAKEIVQQWENKELPYAKALVTCAHQGQELNLDESSEYRMFLLSDQSVAIFHLSKKMILHVEPGLLAEKYLVVK